MAEHKDPTFSTATLDPEDQALLASLQPEGADPGSPAFGAQTERELEEAARAQEAAAGGDPTAAPPAAPAPSPARKSRSSACPNWCRRKSPRNPA